MQIITLLFWKIYDFNEVLNNPRGVTLFFFISSVDPPVSYAKLLYKYCKLHILCAKAFLNWNRNSSQSFKGLLKSFSLPGFAHEKHVRKTKASANKLTVSHSGIVPITQEILTGTTAYRTTQEHWRNQRGELWLPLGRRHSLTFMKFSCIAQLTFGHLWVFFPVPSPSRNEALCFFTEQTSQHSKLFL